MIELYLIRHAESEDNLKGLWAGWKDSVLSNHGMRQAEALAASLSHVPFNALYTSDLKRALSTAKVLRSARREIQNTSCSLHVTSTLREQNFGVAEGTKIVKRNKELSLRAQYAKGLFPALYTRHENYPGGESLEDVRRRAEAFVEDTLMSLIKNSEEGNQKPSIAGVVSHGIFIGELVAALLRKGGRSSEGNTDNFRGMRNTAWTKVEVRVVPVVTDPTQDNNTHALAQGSVIVSTTSLMNLKVIARVVAVNRHPHLSNLQRQGGGIGSMAHDPKQQDIRKFLQVKNWRGPVKKRVHPKEKSK